MFSCISQITTVEEAKEFYPLFGLGANIALIFSGRTVKYFSNLRKTLGPGVDGWAISLKGMMSIVVLLGFVICGIYWGANRFIVNDLSVPRTERKKKVNLQEKKCYFFSFEMILYLILYIFLLDIYTLSQEKPKLGMGESLKVLISSRYVRDLATLVVAYGISINLVEVTWKSKLKAQVIFHHLIPFFIYLTNICSN